MNHFLSLLVFSFFVAAVLSLIAKDGRREVLRYFFFLFGSFVAAALVVGWLMYPFPFGK